MKIDKIQFIAIKFEIDLYISTVIDANTLESIRNPPWLLCPRWFGRPGPRFSSSGWSSCTRFSRSGSFGPSCPCCSCPCCSKCGRPDGSRVSR